MAARPTLDFDRCRLVQQGNYDGESGSAGLGGTGVRGGAEVGGIRNAEYGEVSPERANSRNGYRTRAGTIDLAVSKPRQGSYSPE